MVKTTIYLDQKLWEEFSIKAIKERGGRSKNQIIIALISGYVNNPGRTIKETVNGLKNGRQ